MDFLKGMAGKASATVDEVATAAADTSVFKELEALRSKAAAQAEMWADEKRKLMDDFVEEKKRLLRSAIESRLNRLFDYGMDVANIKAKQKLKDPYMPDCVAGMCDDAVDAIWPDLKLEIKEAILAEFESKRLIVHGEPPCCCMGQIWALLRYYYKPYDRGFWRQLYNPLFWLLQILTLIPKYAVSTMTFILFFIFIDKSDEFMLFEFICDFKALQFITLGVISSFVGSVQYYLCTIANNCDKFAPVEDVWTVALFVLQVVIVWAAFLLMRCSIKKGGFYHQAEEESKALAAAGANTPEARKAALQAIKDGEGGLVSAVRFANEEAMLRDTRGRLTAWLVYDLVIMAICIALTGWMAFANLLDQGDSDVRKRGVDNGNWKFVMSLYWIKALYGVLSFPFLALKLPVFSTLVCHAKPTGFNPYGNTVPYLGIEEEGPVPWRDGHVDHSSSPA